LIKASELRESKLKSNWWIDDILGGGLIDGQSYILCGYFAESIMAAYMISASASGKVIYINSTDYYSVRNIIDQESLAFYIKSAGISIDDALKSIIEISAHSSQRLLNAVKAAMNISGARLLILHGLHSFLKDREVSDTVFYKLKSLAAESRVPFLSITDCKSGAPLVTPTMASMCNYMVAVERVEGGAEFHFLKPVERQLTVRWDKMGRLTHSFRKRYEDYIETLRRDFEPLLRDGNDKALEDLIELAWSPETAAMSALNLPQVSDSMVLVAVIYLMKELTKTKKELEELKGRLH